MLNRPPLVLVAHEDEALRDALGFMLRLEGLEVRAHEGHAALLADAELPRAACLVLPERLLGMDGLHALDDLYAIGIAAPVILITSKATAALRARAHSAGVALVLQKPILDNALIDGVLNILSGGVANGHAARLRKNP